MEPKEKFDPKEPFLHLHFPEMTVRGWHFQHKKFLTPYGISINELLDVFVKVGKAPSPKEILWMVGSKIPDKTGREIMVGDICKQKLETEFGSYIDSVGVMMLNPDSSFGIRHEVGNIEIKGTSEAPEIIGNVFQNPELLTKKS